MLKFFDSQSSVKAKDKRALYKGGKSVYEFLPWVDYEPKSKLWLLEDGHSVCTMIDIQPKACEARPEQYLKEIDDSINTCISAIPQTDPPFIVQFFVYNEESLRELRTRIYNHIPKEHRDTVLTQDFINKFSEHLDLVSKNTGVFHDSDITDSLWFAKTYNVKACIYRKLDSLEELEEGVSATDELLEVSETLIKSLNGIGVKSKRVGQQELYEWLFPFFNDLSEFDGSVDKLLEEHPYPGDENLPFGTDLVKLLFLDEPRSNVEQGTWSFGKTLSKAYTVNAYRKIPKIGHLSAERRHSEKYYAVFDKFPSGTMTNITVVIQQSSATKFYINDIKNSSKGDSAEARKAKKQADAALDHIEENDFLYPVVTTVYMRGNTIEELNKNIRTVKSLLMNNDIHLIESRDDLIPLNSFCTQLPFCYDFKNDTKDIRSRLLFISQISKLLPLYGRSRGTGNPGLVFFNRGAEDFSFDILKDRSSNAFGGILGPPGSGKSALLCFMIWMWAAIYRPRFFILEKGDSFKLLGQFFLKMGLSVNRCTLKPGAKVSLPPFANAIRMVEEEEGDFGCVNTKISESQLDNENYTEAYKDDENIDEKRDWLGEMELLARVMITSGEKREEYDLRTEHKVAIRQAIKNAAITRIAEIKADPNLEENEKLVRPVHVVKELYKLSDEAPDSSAEKDKLRAMAKSMSRYMDGFENYLFNRGGESMPEVDVTIMDFGLLANEGYEGQLALTFMTQMQEICSIAERDQYSGRPIIVIGDEAHLFLKNALLAPYMVKICKMFRKLNTWPWLATQNLADWADESKKMLTMFEWFIAMDCPKEEVEQVSKFRDLDDNQKQLMMSCHKMRGLYTEGVVLSKSMPPALFRNVPPSFALSVAMTDPDEKTVRRKIMEKYSVDELGAVEIIAKQISTKRTAL
ncbi:conjugative transfer ATPase [Aliikangiella maris]|uniref:Conjugative transfer ATPase n=2 Tax=Aliikangiella maris TaxID=3162458 RepID=A0ABV3MTT4_9GAMM